MQQENCSMKNWQRIWHHFLLDRTSCDNFLGRVVTPQLSFILVWLALRWKWEKKITIQKVWTWYCVWCYIAISEFNDPIQHDTLLMPTLAKKCHIIIIIIIRKKLIKKNSKNDELAGTNSYQINFFDVLNENIPKFKSNPLFSVLSEIFLKNKNCHILSGQKHPKACYQYVYIFGNKCT